VIRVGSLFSGVGALDMAVRQALGAEPVPSESWSEPSVTWPRSGTWDPGAAYERPRSAPLIDGTEVFTLAWPASDTDGAGRRSGRGLAGRTGAAVERDGAPAAADATGERRDERRPEPARQLRRSDAVQRGDAAPANIHGNALSGLVTSTTTAFRLRMATRGAALCAQHCYSGGSRGGYAGPAPAPSRKPSPQRPITMIT
jgi:hypothetical protein